MKHLFRTLFFVLFLLTGTAAYAVELKVGHLDLQRPVLESYAGKHGQELLAAKTKSYQDEINIKTEALNKLKANGTATAKQAKLITTRERELQALVVTYQNNLKAYDTDLTRKVVEEFNPILEQYAKRNNYDYIIRNFDGILFANSTHDLTEDLIKEFNTKRNK